MATVVCFTSQKYLIQQTIWYLTATTFSVKLTNTFSQKILFCLIKLLHYLLKSVKFKILNQRASLAPKTSMMGKVEYANAKNRNSIKTEDFDHIQ